MPSAEYADDTLKVLKGDPDQAYLPVILAVGRPLSSNFVTGGCLQIQFCPPFQHILSLKTTKMVGQQN